MAMMIIEYKIMPESPETDLDALKGKASKVIEEVGGFINEVKEIPLGFGLKSLNVRLSIDESKGTELLEEKLKSISDVQNVEIVSLSRALG